MRQGKYERPSEYKHKDTSRKEDLDGVDKKGPLKPLVFHDSYISGAEAPTLLVCNITV